MMDEGENMSHCKRANDKLQGINSVWKKIARKLHWEGLWGRFTDLRGGGMVEASFSCTRVTASRNSAWSTSSSEN